MKNFWNKLTVRVLAGVIIVCGVISASFWSGIQVGKRTPDHVVVDNVTNTTAPADVNADFGTFWQAWQVIQQYYLRDAKVPADQKVQGAIAGMVSSLGDPYTQYFKPSDNTTF